MQNPCGRLIMELRLLQTLRIPNQEIKQLRKLAWKIDIHNSPISTLVTLAKK